VRRGDSRKHLAKRRRLDEVVDATAICSGTPESSTARSALIRDV
jgi:hypothetical protein